MQSIGLSPVVDCITQSVLYIRAKYSFHLATTHYYMYCTILAHPIPYQDTIPCHISCKTLTLFFAVE